MSLPAKIAVVQERDDGLRRLLAEGPTRPGVRSFSNLYDDFSELLAFAPDVVFHAPDEFDAEDVGVLRVLLRTPGRPRLVLVGDAACEVELADFAARLEGTVLLRPFDRRSVAAALAALTQPSGRPDPDAFLDLARGISDEVNNPLLFTLGHLQLLESLLDPSRDTEALEQLRAARRGLAGISATMDRIRTLGRARALPDPVRDVDLAALLREAADDMAATGAGALRVLVPEELAAEDVQVPGDERLLAAAVRALLEVGHGLAPVSDACSVEVSAADAGVRIRLEVRGPAVEDWQLPRTFEPYYLNRVLRGTPHGLGLFLVQTVVHAHGGRALARRRADGTLLLDLLLPNASGA